MPIQSLASRMAHIVTPAPTALVADALLFELAEKNSGINSYLC